MDFYPRLRGSSTRSVYIGQPKKKKKSSSPQSLATDCFMCSSSHAKAQTLRGDQFPHLQNTSYLTRKAFSDTAPKVPQESPTAVWAAPRSPRHSPAAQAAAQLCKSLSHHRHCCPLPLPWLNGRASDARQTLSTGHLLSTPALQTPPWVMLVLPQFPQMPFGHY